MTQTLKTLIPLATVFAFLIATNFIYAAWSAPGGTPSAANNAPAPINVSGVEQTKGGILGAYEFAARDKVKSPLYCDENGENCVAVSGMGGGGDVYNYLDSLWTKVGNVLSTDNSVTVGGDVGVTGKVSAAMPSVDANSEVVTIGFLKALFTNIFGYKDFGNMRNAQNVPQVNYSNMVEFYSPDEETADFLCRWYGFDEGTWTSIGKTTASGWNYSNLSIVTYKPGKGFTNSYANDGQRFTCFGKACSTTYVGTPYIGNLRCLAEQTNELQKKIIVDKVFSASQLSNFSVQISTDWVATTYWGSCAYQSRSDGLNYRTNRTVRCYDSATNSYVSGSQCYGAPLASWKVFDTNDRCNAYRTSSNGSYTPHSL